MVRTSHPKGKDGQTEVQEEGAPGEVHKEIISILEEDLQEELPSAKTTRLHHGGAIMLRVRGWKGSGGR